VIVTTEKQDPPAFQPVSVTLKFTTPEELNTFTDFMVKSAASAARVARTLEEKRMRRSPALEPYAAYRAIRALTLTLQSLTPKPASPLHK
jgi:hypothetical protein